jgi:hypothetical protein
MFFGGQAPGFRDFFRVSECFGLYLSLRELYRFRRRVPSFYRSRPSFDFVYRSFFGVVGAKKSAEGGRRWAALIFRVSAIGRRRGALIIRAATTLRKLCDSMCHRLMPPSYRLLILCSCFRTIGVRSNGSVSVEFS